MATKRHKRHKRRKRASMSCIWMVTWNPLLCLLCLFVA